MTMARGQRERMMTSSWTLSESFYFVMGLLSVCQCYEVSQVKSFTVKMCENVKFLNDVIDVERVWHHRDAPWYVVVVMELERMSDHHENERSWYLRVAAGFRAGSCLSHDPWHEESLVLGMKALMLIGTFCHFLWFQCSLSWCLTATHHVRRLCMEITQLWALWSSYIQCFLFCICDWNSSREKVSIFIAPCKRVLVRHATITQQSTLYVWWPSKLWQMHMCLESWSRLPCSSERARHMQKIIAVTEICWAMCHCKHKHSNCTFNTVQKIWVQFRKHGMSPMWFNFFVWSVFDCTARAHAHGFFFQSCGDSILLWQQIWHTDEKHPKFAD